MTCLWLNYVVSSVVFHPMDMDCVVSGSADGTAHMTKFSEGHGQQDDRCTMTPLQLTDDTHTQAHGSSQLGNKDNLYGSTAPVTSLDVDKYSGALLVGTKLGDLFKVGLGHAGAAGGIMSYW